MPNDNKSAAIVASAALTHDLSKFLPIRDDRENEFVYANYFVLRGIELTL